VVVPVELVVVVGAVRVVCVAVDDVEPVVGVTGTTAEEDGLLLELPHAASMARQVIVAIAARKPMPMSFLIPRSIPSGLPLSCPPPVSRRSCVGAF
jgi:hypothetical protein